MEPLLYRICVRATLHEGWSAWFDGLAIEPGPDDSTLLTGVIVDQAALHGVLAKIRDLGLTLLSVESCAGRADVPRLPGPPGHGAPAERPMNPRRRRRA